MNVKVVVFGGLEDGPEVRVVPADGRGALGLATLQGIVGGYIEDVTAVVPGLPRGVRVIADEEGRLKRNRTVTSVNGVELVGPVVLVRAKGADYVGLTAADVAAVMS